MNIIFKEQCNWKNISLFSHIYEDNNVPIYWRDFFYTEQVQNEIKKISDFLQTVNVNIFPEIEKVFRAFFMNPKNIKLIILSQDPYHNRGSAVGLCFSVPKNSSINPSLRNIYTELENEGFKVNKNGCLEYLQKQGCFLINSALTVEEGNPESHIEIWAIFTDLVIKHLQSFDNVAWLLMGSKAISYKSNITNPTHKLFLTSHPSPFSAYRSSKVAPAFMGSNVFKQINEFLGNRAIKF